VLRDSNGPLGNSASIKGRRARARSLPVRAFANAALRTAWTYTPSATLRWDVGAEFACENAELNFYRNEFIGDLAADSFGRSRDATITSDQAPHSSTFGVFASAHRYWHALEGEAGLRLTFGGHQTGNVHDRPDACVRSFQPAACPI